MHSFHICEYDYQMEKNNSLDSSLELRFILALGILQGLKFP